ncbi:hypothetical protein BaRGS_00018673, partial [Batillaria attramentaria]
MLWTREAVSKSQCAVLCVQSGTCASFTFSRAAGSLLTSCRAYTRAMASLDAAITYANAKYYVIVHKMDWMDTACSDGSECPAHNSGCYSGRCLCDWGFFYSETSHICLT